MRGLRINPDGHEEPLPDKTFTVSELQDMVGGFIEITDTPDGVLVYDVDGAVKDKLYNKSATGLIRTGEMIAGVALLLSPGSIKAD